MSCQYPGTKIVTAYRYGCRCDRCVDGMTAYQRAYRDHPNSKKARKRASNAAFEKRRRAIVSEVKLSRGCVDCGYNDTSAALDFDHRDPEEKRFGIADKLTTRLSTLIVEILKCDVVCANCHRVRTHVTRNTKEATT